MHEHCSSASSCHQGPLIWKCKMLGFCDRVSLDSCALWTGFMVPGSSAIQQCFRLRHQSATHLDCHQRLIASDVSQEDRQSLLGSVNVSNPLPATACCTTWSIIREAAAGRSRARSYFRSSAHSLQSHVEIIRPIILRVQCPTHPAPLVRSRPASSAHTPAAPHA